MADLRTGSPPSIRSSLLDRPYIHANPDYPAVLKYVILEYFFPVTKDLTLGEGIAQKVNGILKNYHLRSKISLREKDDAGVWEFSFDIVPEDKVDEDVVFDILNELVSASPQIDVKVDNQKLAEQGLTLRITSDTGSKVKYQVVRP